MADDVNALRPALVGIGFAEMGAAPENHYLEGWLPISSLPQIESLTADGLWSVLPVWKPRTSVGLTTSQADWTMEADRVQAALPASYNGAGVKIGVLSDSFDAASSPITNASQDVANGDLPGPGNPDGYSTPVQLIQEGAGEDEGRAMAQLIHDVAPGASLAFATANGGQANFAANIQALANAGSKVIVDDVFYFDEPYFQYGTVAQAVKNVVTNNGVAYFSSAGNQADQAWESDNPVPTVVGSLAGVTNGVWFDFDPSSGIDVTQRITIHGHSSANLWLQWDQPFYTSNQVTSDVNFYMLDTLGNVLFLSNDDNPGGTHTPLEVLQVTNSGATDVQVDLAIRLFSGPTVGRLKYEDFGGGITVNEYATNSSTISKHAGIPEAAGVGAVPYQDQRTREAFTSSGPMTVIFDNAGNRIFGGPLVSGPLIAAPDGTNTSFFVPGDDPDGDGHPNFHGTSAAAPHAAAVAALVRQAFPSLTPFQVYQKLVDSADSNTDAPGYDKYTGWGLIDAYRAIFGTSPANAGGSFQDNFDSGALAPQWETYSTGAGRIQVTSANGPLSGSHVILQQTFGEVPGIWTSGLNELTLHVNPNAPDSTGILLFSEKEFNDDDNPMPGSAFTGSVNADGVSFSVDGNTWFPLLSLTGGNSTAGYNPLGSIYHDRSEPRRDFDSRYADQIPGIRQREPAKRRHRLRQHQLRRQSGPAFTVGPNQTVNEDAGPQTVPTWPLFISPGPTARARLSSIKQSTSRSFLIPIRACSP